MSVVWDDAMESVKHEKLVCHKCGKELIPVEGHYGLTVWLCPEHGYTIK